MIYKKNKDVEANKYIKYEQYRGACTQILNITESLKNNFSGKKFLYVLYF